MEIGIFPFIRLNQQSLMHHVVLSVSLTIFVISQCFNKKSCFQIRAKDDDGPTGGHLSC